MTLRFRAQLHMHQLFPTLPTNGEFKFRLYPEVGRLYPHGLVNGSKMLVGIFKKELVWPATQPHFLYSSSAPS